ncbi:MAG: putative cathepsin B4 cysteine protease, partial [Streblomastix strix]
ATDKCISYSASNLPCPKSCNDGTKIKRTPVSKFRFVNSSNIQDEIYKNSTVSANMIVYSDFMNYKSGVYIHQTGLSTGSHAVIIIGWGIENNIPYWLVQNSWGQDWGEKGYFKIIRGNDHCGIESSVTTGDPKCVKE